MGHIIADLKETFRRGNIFIQLIYINVGIFLIGTLINVFLRLFQQVQPRYIRYICFTGILYRFIHQPWSLFTYMFMHAGILHILFNMLWLYWFGSLFLYFFLGQTFKRTICIGRYLWRFTVYGCLQCISFIQFASGFSTLVGSFGFRISHRSCTAYREPNYRVQLFFSVLSVSNIWHWLLSESMYYPSPQVMPEDISPT